jgi:hypothetical protein
MNLQEIIDFVLLRMNEDQSGMSISPDLWTPVFRAVNLEYTKQRLGLPEDYQPLAPYTRQGYQISQRMQDDTRRLVTEVSLPVTAGKGAVPSNYLYMSSLSFEYIYNNATGLQKEIKTVEVLPDQDFVARKASSLMRPTFKNPIARFVGNDIEFEPSSIKSVNMVYVRTPNEPLYAYTVNANDDYVYNAAGSVQFDWPKICMPDIANMVLSYLSDNFRDMFIKQSAENRKAQGI